MNVTLLEESAVSSLFYNKDDRYFSTLDPFAQQTVWEISESAFPSFLGIRHSALANLIAWSWTKLKVRINALALGFEMEELRDSTILSPDEAKTKNLLLWTQSGSIIFLSPESDHGFSLFYQPLSIKTGFHVPEADHLDMRPARNYDSVSLLSSFQVGASLKTSVLISSPVCAVFAGPAYFVPDQSVAQSIAEISNEFRSDNRKAWEVVLREETVFIRTPNNTRIKTEP